MPLQPSRSSAADENAVTLSDIVILGFTALILALPMLIYGPMVNGHDTYEHLNYCRHFAEQFWGGELYPRWLLNMCHGLGSPSLFVYPPFACYVDAFLLPLGRAFHFNAFNAGEFLALFSSGVCAFLWAHTTASRRVALASAVLYMLLPYHLSVDFYRRTALSECWALAWMPLLLYFTTLTMTRKRTALLGVALAYALLILSHLVSVLIFSFIPLALCLVLFGPGKKVDAVLRTAAGMALGTGLSCFYFLPALLQAKYFPVLRTLRPPYYVLEENFIRLADLAHRGAMGGFAFWVSVTALTVMVFILTCASALLLKGRPDSRRLILFWLAACAVPVLLMSSVSLPVWHFVLPLFKGVQYPWRFNVVLCLAALFIAARFLSDIPRFSAVARIALLIPLCGIVLTWIFSYGQVWKRYRTDVYVHSARQFVSDDDGWFDSWSVPGLDQESALRASAAPRVRFLGAFGTLDLEQWKARQIKFQTNSPTGGWVEVNQFYYPGWHASAGAGRMLEIRTVMPEGLMEVEVPPGAQEVCVELPAVPGERAGGWITIASLLICGALAWRMKPEPLAMHIESRSGNASRSSAGPTS